MKKRKIDGGEAVPSGGSSKSVEEEVQEDSEFVLEAVVDGRLALMAIFHRLFRILQRRVDFLSAA